MTESRTSVESVSQDTEFNLVTHVDDINECAAPNCKCDPRDTHHDLSLMLECDMNAMLADYANVEFCSIACVRKLVVSTPLRDLDELDHGVDTIIFADEPVIAHVEADDQDDPVFSALACNTERAIERASEYITPDTNFRNDDSGLDPDSHSITLETL